MPATVNISYPPQPVAPATSTNVPGSGGFIAYGYAAPATAVVGAWVVDGGNNVVAPGQHIAPPPPSTWACSFQGIQLNTPYNLLVRAVAPDGSTDQKTVSITCVAP